jgi:hypothetical protein
MEQQLRINSNYDSLDKVMAFLKPKTSYNCSQEYNTWEVATGSEIPKCILVKKSAMIGLKIDFSNQNTLKIMPVVPSKFLVSFTEGKGIAPPIVRALLSGGQKKLVNEVSEKLVDIQD